MNLDNAIAVHAQWKMKFRGAIVAKETLDAAVIAQDNCCEIGKWLHGEGRSAWGAKPEFVALIERHKTFHVEAGKVASAINARNFDLATRMIDGSTPFAAASSTVGVAILALKRAIAQAANV
jgi:methyl-accepting chemotaxis protein